MTYFDEMLPASHPAGASGVQICLSPGMACMQGNVRNIACPDRFVTWLSTRFKTEQSQTSRQKNTRTFVRTGDLDSMSKSVWGDLLYRLHPCRRPFGLPLVVQKHSRCFCHFVQVGHPFQTSNNKKGHPYRSGLFYYIKAWQ